MSTAVRPSLIEIAPQTMRPTALPDHVYAVLKQKILSCALPPNERLWEKDLCTELQVSRTPLREALNRLSHEGLVSFQPHAGYRVRPLTLTGFRQLIEFRAIVEPNTTALATERATEADIAELRQCASLPFDLSDDRYYVDYCRANARFHLAVARCARNTMLENVLMSALDMYQRPTYLRIGRQHDAGDPSAKHHAIVDAMERHQPTEARQLMEKHVRGGGERIFAALSAAGYQ
jgi:GntR family transcriptional regulator, rspAB operon transcriptional repressor